MLRGPTSPEIGVAFHPMVSDIDNHLAARSEPDSSPAETRAEIAALRSQNVVLTRELSVLRWQFAKLLEQQPPIRAGLMRAKALLWRRFPRPVEKIAMLKRIIKARASAYRRAVAKPASERSVKIGPRLSLRPPFLLVTEGRGAQDILRGAVSADVVCLTPGAGLVNNLPVPPVSAPTLQGAAPGSLAAYLVESPALLRNISTIVIDQGDDISLALLRGRLVHGQALVLVRSSKDLSENALHLGEPDVCEDGIAVYSKLPDEWLDPLDAQGHPRTDSITGVKWPKISVVMVSFNQADFLEQGLRSVLNQGYPNLEFLVVDGKSTDGSIDILERYRARLTYLLIEPDRGQSDGLNKGFARASGDILTWVNSDDLLEPGALFRVAQAYSFYKTDMIVGGCRQIGLARQQVIHNHHTKLPYGVPLLLPLGLLLEMDRFWLNGCFFYQPEVFFTRDIWQRSGGKLRADLNYVLDYDLWVRMAAAGATIVHIHDFLACSRTHDQQKTTVGMPYLPEVQRLLREYAVCLLPTTPRGF